MNIATALIAGNGRVDLFELSQGSDTFAVFAKQTPGECRTGRLSLYIKANNEKAQRIGFHTDIGTVEELIGYVRDELIEAAE
jgi:hypothetical protein